MHRRIVTAVVAVCALGALAPAAAPAAEAAGPDFPSHCFYVYGPSPGPVKPVVDTTLCVVDHYLP